MVDADDWLEVRSLVAKYNRSFDSGDVESWLETFAEDGIFVSKDQGEIVGHAALREWFTSRDHKTIHVTSDPTIDAEGNELHHVCTIMVFRHEEDGVALTSVGQYDDWLTKGPQGWRFRSRRPTTESVKHV